MPVKLQKIARREVVTLREGRRLGRPLDILVDTVEHRVAYLVLATGRTAETAVIVPGSAVQSYASDTLAVDSFDVLEIAARSEAALRLLTQGTRLRGQPVLSGAGGKLGRIATVLVDERGGVTQYRIRRRFFGLFRPALKIGPSDLRTSGGEIAVLGGPTSPPDEAETPPG